MNHAPPGKREHGQSLSRVGLHFRNPRDDRSYHKRPQQPNFLEEEARGSNEPCRLHTAPLMSLRRGARTDLRRLGSARVLLRPWSLVCEFRPIVGWLLTRLSKFDDQPFVLGRDRCSSERLDETGSRSLANLELAFVGANSDRTNLVPCHMSVTANQWQ